MDNNNLYALIIGAGPSGLALAYELIELNSRIKPVIIEKLPVVGGLSRTIYDGKSGFDIGGHRLFTKDKYIESIWKKFLTVQNTPAIDDFLAHRNLSYPKDGADPNFVDDTLLIRKRFSSIIKSDKIYKYPLRFDFATLKNLGFISSILAILSYIKALFVNIDVENIENFLIKRFGKYLYNLFFKTCTKKMWGYEGKDLINNWPDNKIQKSLFRVSGLWEDEFYYPKFGCSQLWNKMAKYITDHGGQIITNCEFQGFNFENGKIVSAFVKHNNEIKTIPARYYISSIPVSELIKTVDAPYDIKQHALNLPYRDYISVNFLTGRFNLKNYSKFQTVNNIAPDNWIYLQNDNTIASRLQIINNWSPYLVDDYKNNYLISLEYFCNFNDDYWKMSDYELTRLAILECEKYKFFTKFDIYNSKVIRQEKAYPVFQGSYKYINKIKKYLSKYNNLYLMGRNGEHKYINMDYAMVCGINIARDINKRV